ncbi:T9SS type B sorting domain-containing protein [Aquimarina pacifica]|uniref:T9SS type B sorting domain-containing protein n=1 Tax=Aquimarina pacifica TaxID=1296415 RepID=UPI00046F52EE|nr:T9SS type B sorting domain-containing protein [Aquimarina pacifica]
MKLRLKYAIILVLLMIGSQLSAQRAFAPVPNSTLTINGELKVIGNSIVGLDQGLRTNCQDCDRPGGSGGRQCVIYDPEDDYNLGCSNNGRVFDYIDIDGDTSTFSSSSAELVLPTGCERVAYAGLYWAASYFVERDSDGNVEYDNLPFPDNRPDFATIKLKHEDDLAYTEITNAEAQIIYDGYRNTTYNPSNVAAIDIPYVCYADVTSYIAGLTDPSGYYTIADMRAATGGAYGTTNGISGGWVLVVAYEDPTLSAKYISTSNGYLNNQPCTITDPGCLKDFSYSGFTTLPAPLPVRARYAIATLEGDQPYTGDVFQIERPDATTQDIFTNPANPSNNFFDSSISVDGQYVTNRVPASENTLGFDVDIFDIPNPSNTVIGNDQNSATFYTTSSGDAYSVFFNSFQIEIIEPKLTVTKRVYDTNGIDITGNPVNFADQLFYELTIENQGNEDITGYDATTPLATITDVLPDNVDFTLGTITTSNIGVVATVDGTGRQIDITIEDDLVVQDGGIHTVRFGVSVVATCADLRDACSNQINNVAYSRYSGVESGFQRDGEASILEQDACKFDVVGTSNVLINDGICFTESQPAFICTGSLDLTAGGLYTSYEWIETSDPGTILGNDQTLTGVTDAGTYQVTKIGDADCQDGIETFVVDAFTSVVNPIIDIAANLDSNPNVNGSTDRTCAITAETLPELFLCGSGTTFTIDSGFSAATSIEWQRLDPSDCGSVTRNPNCPTPVIDSGACESEWTTEGTAPTFTVTQAGEYRINVTFDSNCTIPFYFNVFQNNFDPELEVIDDILCGAGGSMHVANSSNQYEYQLVAPSGATIGYQASAVFTGLTEEGLYTVNVRQTGGLATACVFQDTASLLDLDADITVTPTTLTCPDDLGEIEIVVTDSQINYTYTITSTTTAFTDTEGPTTLPSHTFTGLNPDTYDIQVLSADGACTDIANVQIVASADFSATAVLISDLRCNPGYQPDPTLNDPAHPNYDPTALPFDDNEFIAVYEVTITGGSGNYAFNDAMDFSGTVLEPITSTTYQFIADSAGNYPVYIEDLDSNCVIFAGSVDVSPYVPITATATAIEPSCSGDSASILVDVLTGQGPYTYILDGSAIATGVNTDPFTFNNLDATNTYVVTVEDGLGCSIDLDPISFTSPGVITADVDVTKILDCTASPDATVSVTNIDGGSLSYEWSLSATGPFTAVVGTSFTEDFATDGTYTIYIRNSGTSDCVENFSVTIDPLLEVDSVTITPGTQDCTNQTVDVTLSALPALIAPEEYEFSITPDPASGAAASGGPTAFSNVTAYTFTNGVAYTVTARRSDTECTNTGTFSGPLASEIEITSATQDSPVTCNGDIDGVLTFTVANSTTFDYTVESSGGTLIASATGNTTNPVTITGSVATPLGADTYTITVTDTSLASGNCTDTTTVEITEPSTLSFTPVVDDADCGADTGIITINASGGNGGYEYELRDAGGLVITAYQSGNSFSPLAAATYIVAVRDGNDTTACEVTQTVPVGATTVPVIVTATGGDPCYDTTDQATQWITITGAVSPIVDAYTYSLDGNAPVAVDFTLPVTLPVDTFEIPGLTPGTHTVSVTNTVTLCTSADITFDINEELTITANLTKDLDCNGDATIEFSASGGDSSYTFNVTGTAGQTGVTSPASIPAAGTYQIVVTDGLGCTATSADIDVNTYVALAANAVETDPVCPSEDGSILVTITAGEGPFIYDLDGGTEVVGPTSSLTNVFNNVSVGNHTIDITDGDGCPLTPTLSATITAPTALTASIAVTQEYRCDLTTGSSATPQLGTITVSSPANGNGSYEYSIDGVDFTNVTGVFTGLTDGTYTVYIQDTDTGACPVNLGSLTIDPLQEVTDIAFVQTQVQCPAQTADVTLTASGTNGASSFEYQITAPAASAVTWQASNVFSSLPAGDTYTFEARTTTDGCVYTEDYTIDAIDQIAVNGTVTAEPTCNGDTDAALSFTVTGIDLTSTTYSYEVTGGTIVGSVTGTGLNTVPEPITGLGDGSYDIEVTDDTTNCVDNLTIVITDPDILSFGTVVVNSNCGANNGTITVTAAGGNGGYEYELRDNLGTPITTYQSSNVFTALAPGVAPNNYIVAVRDGNSAAACEVTQNVDVAEDLPPTIALGTGGDLCYDTTDLASIEIDITSGGIAPFTYSVDGAAGVPVATTPTFTIPNLTPGSYSVTVSDSNGCISNAVTFDIEPQLTISATLTKDLDCSASPNATIDVTTTGGNGTNTFEVDIDGAGYVAYAGAFPFSASAAGTYQFRVTDSESCTAESAVITVTDNPDPVASAVGTDPICNGDTNGSVEITVDTTVGTAPYLINFNGLGDSAQTVYGGLSAGIYNYTVTDDKGCSETFSVTLTNPNIIVGTRNVDDISCDSTTGATTPGLIEYVNITGATPPYTISLLNAADSSLATTTSSNPATSVASGSTIGFDDLAFGDYIYRVVDANNCTYDFNESISTTPIFVITPSFTAGVCAAGVDLSINISGGNGSLGFQIREYPSGVFAPVNLPPRDHLVTGLPFDTPFTFEVLDVASGCTDIQTVTPPGNPSTINIAITETNITCVGADDGEIAYSITGYQGTELTYSIYRTDDLATPITGSYTFSAGNPQTVLAAGTGAGTVDSFNPGTYLFRVEETDALVGDQCNAAIEFEITEPGTPLTYDRTDTTLGNCNAPAQGTVFVTGGTSPYQYVAVEDGDPNSGAYVSSNVLDLDHTTNTDWDIYIRDASNCVIGPFDVTVSSIPDPVFTAVPTLVDDPCVYDNEYRFTVTATGTGQLSYSSDGVSFVDDGGSHEYIVTAPGTYTLTVRDPNGCFDTATITVYEELLVDANFTTEPTCRDADGEITVTIGGGSSTFAANPSNFTFVLNGTDSGGFVVGPISQNGLLGTENIFTGISAGTYTISVTDAISSCTVTDDVTRDIPVDPIVSVATDFPTPETCVGANDGTILVQLDGAADDDPPYSYELWLGATGTGTFQYAQTDDPLFTGLAPNTYGILVRSVLGCVGTVEGIDIDSATDPTAAITTTEYACDTDNAAVFPVITLDNFADGTPPYRISYTGPSVTVTNQDPATIDTNALLAGVQIVADEVGAYDFTIIDDNNCSNALPTVTIDPYPIMSNPTVVRDVGATNAGVISCDNPETVIVSVTRVTGNTSGYQFDLLPLGTDTQTIAEDASGTTSATFTINATGDYTFMITDLDTGCTINTAPYSIGIFDTIAVTATEVTSVSCNGDATGEIELNVTGYTGAYNYEVVDAVTGVAEITSTLANTATNPITISGITAGNYEVNVEALDTPFCDEVSNTVNVSEPTALTLISNSASTPNCNDLLSDVSVTAGGGVGPYEYQAVAGVLPMADPATFPLTNEFSLDPATSLNWVVFVRDANLCITPLAITIPDVDPAPTLDPIPPFVDDACNFDNTYEFTVTATSNVTAPGSTGELTYQLGTDVPVAGSVDNNTHQFIVTGPGTYTVTVYDENGCPSASQTIDVYPELSVTATFTDPTCRDNDATIIATISGGSDITVNPGNFSFDLVNAVSGITIPGVTQTPGPGADQITFSSTVAGTDGIFPGDYTVEATDNSIAAAPGCTATFDITVPTYVDPIPSAATTPVSCFGDTDGTILISLDAAADDNPPYSYTLFVYDPTVGVTGALVAGPQTDPLFDDSIAPIPAGDYEVVITSDKGCAVTLEPINVAGPTAALSVTDDQTTYGCDTNNDSVFPVVTLTIAGGTPPYDVSYVGLSSSGSDTDIVDADLVLADVQYDFTAPVAGTYVVTVTDDRNCIVANYNVVVPAFEIMNNPAATTVTPIDCAPTDEVVRISIEDGSGDFLFERVEPDGLGGYNVFDTVDPAATVLFADFTLTGLDVGIYTFRITDDNTGCTEIVTHEILEYDTIEASLELVSDVSCFGALDGSVRLTVTGYPVAPVTPGNYDYDVINSDTGLSTGITGSSDVASGPLVIGGLDGINVFVRVTATQAPLCDADSNIIGIATPSAIIVAVSQIQDETCNPGDDASIEVVALGGTTPYTYQLENTIGGVITNTGGTVYDFATNGSNTIFTELDAGIAPAGIDYVVRVRDANGCEMPSLPFNIQPPTALGLNAIAPLTLLCSDSQDGTITATATGGQGIGTYFFALTLPDGTQSAAVNNGTDSFTWNDLQPGNYVVTVSDNLACEAFQDPVVIDTPPEVTVAIAPNTVDSCLTVNPNEVVVTAGGGIGAVPGDYEYGISDDNGVTITWQASDTFPLTVMGDYSFYTRDGNLCESMPSNTIQARPPNPFVVTLDTSNTTIVCFNEATGSINSLAIGGLGNYMYTVSGTDYLGNAVGPIGPQAESFFGNLLAGNYTYTTSSGDCVDDVQVFDITQPLELEITIEEFPISCSGETDGSIRVTAIGGNQNVAGSMSSYFYSLYNELDEAVYTFIEDDADGLLGEHTFIELPEGTYRVEVEDFKGCPVEAVDIIIIEPDGILASIDATTPETCLGDEDGTATISFTGGLAPDDPLVDPSYYWSIDGTNYQALIGSGPLFIENLPGGTTTLFVRDSQNSADCEGAFNIDIEPGVDLGAELEERLECPIYDYTNPTAPELIQGVQYFVEFNIIEASERLDIIYTLNGINGTPNPTNNTNLTGIFEVAPGEYEGIMEYQACIQTVDTIEVNEYEPLSTPVAIMTNNPQDPNEYEITVSGGRPFENEPFYAFAFAMLDNELTEEELGVALEALEQSDFTSIEENIFSIRETANYVLQVVDADGCESLVVQNLTYINIRIPNYFTPDAPNTTTETRFWYPRQISPDPNDPFYFENMEVMVFDRYGRMLGEFKGDQTGWDGYYQGKQLPSGDYWYTIILNDVDNREFTGHFTLYR